ncbi:MAG TPA: IPT/TIG domain-containing protein [Solirubrobacteraceae bacterium]|jgi:hypothetical protein|nr:IPT/TIG domain-containing protein [Solirubrobacteraceae bacterium]
MDRASSRALTSRWHLAFVVLACTAMLAAGAGSASAVIVTLPSGKALSYQPLRGAAVPALTTVQPFDRFFSNLDYNGGPVMPSNTNYAFYWDPAGAPAYPAEYESGIDQYLEDLAHDSGGHQNVDSVSAQYNDAAGAFASYSSRFAGAIIDTDPYPANGCTRATICLTDAQLQAELSKYVAAHGLPHDLSHEYFMLTPPGVEDCFEASGRECSAGSSKPVYCAYHGNIPLPEGEIVYANDPYVTGIAGCDDGNHPNGKPSDGALEGGLSHEHNESITDPEPNNAWTDIGGSGGEVGDKCEESMGSALGSAPDGASYNQVIDGHFYWYQEEWSNQSHQCLQRLTFSGAVPTATFTSTPGGGEKVSFDATGSSAPGGVARYNWQFNDGPGLSTPTETTAPTVTHMFPAAGSYVVALTVFASDGTSIGTAHSIVVGTLPAPTVTKLSPKTGPAAGGTSVKITGAAFSGATEVRFGSQTASFKVNSATSITATAPAGSSATVDVTVTTPQGTSATTSADRFKYATATVTGVGPSSGSIAGGTTVTITGSGFALGAATTFLFGKVAASSVTCSSTSSCTAVAPAASKPATVDVIAEVGGKKSKKNPPADSFTYTQ